MYVGFYMGLNVGDQATYNISAGAFSANNAISGTGNVVKVGTGIQTLTNTSTYSGGTNISSGTLLATAPMAIGTGPVTLARGTLNLSGHGTVSGFSNLKTNGVASIVNGNLQLTNGSSNVAGSAFTGAPVYITEPAGLAVPAVGLATLVIHRYRRRS